MPAVARTALGRRAVRARGQVGVQVAAGLPFDPRGISGLRLWLDASDLATITMDGSNRVASWADKSGRAFGPLAQGTDANKPVWTANRQNGRAGLVFTAASNQWLALDTPLFTDYPATVIVVAKPSSDTASMVAFWCGDKDSTVDEVYLAWRGDQANDPLWLGMTTAGAGNAAVSGSGFTVNVAGIGAGRLVAAADRKVRFNAGTEGTTTNSKVMQNYDRTAIGRRMQSTPSFSFGGDVYEVLVYNRALTDTEIDHVRRKLAEKWAISAAAS